ASEAMGKGFDNAGKGKGKGKNGKDGKDGKGKGSKGKDGKGKDGKAKGRDGKGKDGKGKDSKGKGHWFETVDREQLVALNRKIASHAQVKDLAACRKVLEELEGKGWANGHTYAAAVNALCRCGDWRGAEAALERATTAGLFRRGAGAASGVITRTSMLRGYVDCARDLGRARSLLERMEADKVVAARPNVRTANTYLRGCLVLGEVGDAEDLLQRMETHWAADDDWRDFHGGAPDATSYETVVALLCQALRFEDARKLAKKALEKLGPSPGCAAMYVAIARAACVRCDHSAAAGAAKRARELLEHEGSKSEGGWSVAGSGGKRGTVKISPAEWKKEGDADDGARNRSNEVFQNHRRSELLAEIRDIESAVGAAASDSTGGGSSSSQTKRKRPSTAIDLGALWSRTLSFADHREQKTKQESMPAAMCRRLCEKLGMTPSSSEAKAVNEHFRNALRGGSNSGSGEQTPSLQPPKKKRKKGSPAVKTDTAAGDGAVSIDGRLDLAALFSRLPGKTKPTLEELDSAGKASAVGRLRPVRLELCSGGGEWLCAQALRDPQAAWVACELRFDRVARCFQRLALRGLAAAEGNAGIIVGDARDALERRIAPGCCSRLFINHPEPPHQTDLEKAASAGEASDSKYGTEATHLLTVSFLRDACGSVLKPGGILTVCTDNLDYGKWLMEAFASTELAKLFEDALHGSKTDQAGKAARKGSVCLRSEPPPQELCGACYTGEDGASYFQRLKSSEKGSRGQYEGRYFLCLRRRPSDQ
ncbi:unnamed protein product, partial [Polarella glacialis]